VRAGMVVTAKALPLDHPSTLMKRSPPPSAQGANIRNVYR
jgi:hypothetical protein